MWIYGRRDFAFQCLQTDNGVMTLRKFWLVINSWQYTNDNRNRTYCDVKPFNEKFMRVWNNDGRRAFTIFTVFVNSLAGYWYEINGGYKTTGFRLLKTCDDLRKTRLVQNNMVGYKRFCKISIFQLINAKKFNVNNTFWQFMQTLHQCSIKHNGLLVQSSIWMTLLLYINNGIWDSRTENIFMFYASCPKSACSLLRDPALVTTLYIFSWVFLSALSCRPTLFVSKKKTANICHIV